MHDVLLNKVAIIKRCLEKFTAAEDFKSNITRQDSVMLNIQRACEACIDIANFLIKQNNLAIPQSAGDSFDIISRAEVIEPDLATQLKRWLAPRI